MVYQTTTCPPSYSGDSSTSTHVRVNGMFGNAHDGSHAVDWSTIRMASTSSLLRLTTSAWAFEHSWAHHVRMCSQDLVAAGIEPRSEICQAYVPPLRYCNRLRTGLPDNTKRIRLTAESIGSQTQSLYQTRRQVAAHCRRRSKLV